MNSPAWTRHSVKPGGSYGSWHPHSLSGVTAKAGENGGETLEMMEWIGKKSSLLAVERGTSKKMPH